MLVCMCASACGDTPSVQLDYRVDSPSAQDGTPTDRAPRPDATPADGTVADAPTHDVDQGDHDPDALAEAGGPPDLLTPDAGDGQTCPTAKPLVLTSG